MTDNTFWDAARLREAQFNEDSLSTSAKTVEVEFVRPKDIDGFFVSVHRDNAHWWHDPATGAKLARNMGEMLMLVISEIAECMEGERKDLMDDHLPHRKMAEVELADAMIRIADIVGSMGQIARFGFAFQLAQAGVRARPECVTDSNKAEELREICAPLAAASLYTPIGEWLGHMVTAFLRIEAYASDHGYDLWGAVAEKREYNKHRADHKPEARLAAGGKKW